MPKLRTPRVGKKTRRERWKPEHASAVLAKHAASGLSIRQFAEREGLDPERLYRWRRSLGGPAPAPAAFVEIRPRGRTTIELVLRSGHVLFVSEAMDVGMLRQLVDALDRDVVC